MLNTRQFTKHSVTLIELLIAIAVTTILFGVVILMFTSSLDSFSITQQDLSLQKALDDILAEITEGGFEYYGLIDAVEFIHFSETSVKFIPIWIDQPADAGDNKRFFLTKPFQAGRSAPLVEVKFPYFDEFKPEQANFVLGQHTDPLFNDDMIEFNKALPLGSKVRAVYVPNKSAKDAVFSFNWNRRKGVLNRTYKNITSTIPSYAIEGVKISDVRFEYFDNTNSPIPIEPNTKIIDKDLFPFVTAIRVWAKVESKGKSREDSAFINIRNTRTSGAGIIIREGTRVKIPDSRHIRTLSISNITQIPEPGVIEIKAAPKVGNAWKIILNLDLRDKKPIIEKYSIEYPEGNTVYTETIDMTIDMSLNLLTLGGSGRYDYDYDLDAENVVLLEGDVELAVTKMDAEAASLYVRP